MEPTFEVRPLEGSTWPDFARLVEANNGVWGGCWCMGFHPEGFGDDNRAAKECRVREGRAHAALVYDGEECVGWCQFGSPEEVPRIKHQRAYREVATEPPDWRITCFFVGKGQRGRGVADRALAGALELIAGHGGGTVESFPELVEDRTTSGSFLHNATVSMFERQGFERTRRIGKHRWIVTRAVRASRPEPT
jgi:ribosomal protein S18 acetylase RimI-like enzyme